ncbi:MAG: ribbon-helix-helix protein, CopG family [Deltaproteobacteria bacterium]|nr:ribbon-helix-helix protein, CopG family [Deltaproteobacteria bacterium]
MKLFDFPKRERRDTPLTVRLPASVIEKLKELAKRYGLSQTDVIEHLIERAHEEATKQPKKK